MKMPDPMMIEKAELNQILRWLTDIEETVQLYVSSKKWGVC
jgi:hypothetical protein